MNTKWSSSHHWSRLKAECSDREVHPWIPVWKSRSGTLAWCSIKSRCFLLSGRNLCWSETSASSWPQFSQAQTRWHRHICPQQMKACCTSPPCNWRLPGRCTAPCSGAAPPSKTLGWKRRQRDIWRLARIKHTVLWEEKRELSHFYSKCCNFKKKLLRQGEKSLNLRSNQGRTCKLKK